MFKQIFSNKLAFEPIDPLGDGLGDLIDKERSNPDTTAFQHELDGERLIDFWTRVERDIKKSQD